MRTGWLRYCAAPLFAVLTFCQRGLACPLIDGLVDMNCDQLIKIAITGDSIVRGRNDPDITEDSGGYVLDLQQAHPDWIVENLGVSGISSHELLRSLRLNAPRRTKTWRKLKDADYILIEVGTNDYWTFNPPAATIRNIDRIRLFLKEFAQEEFSQAPLIAVATLPPTLRAFQKAFISLVDRMLLLPYYKRRLGVQVRFDLLKPSILSFDQVHPGSKGYEEMAEVAMNAFTGPLQERARASRRDADADGIFDMFEQVLFGTNPAVTDSDGDGCADGEEVFVRHSDPVRSDAEPDPPMPLS